MTLLQDVRKDALYLATNITGGNFSPSSPKYEAAIIDAETLIRNLRRLIYATHPPATIDEQLSYIVSNIAAIAAGMENLVSQIAQDTDAAVNAAAARVITALGDVAALKQAVLDAQTAQKAAEDALVTANQDSAADATTLTGTIATADSIAPVSPV